MKITVALFIIAALGWVVALLLVVLDVDPMAGVVLAGVAAAIAMTVGWRYAGTIAGK